MISASGFKGIDSMFSSMISTSQSDGHRAASVASPSGGFIVLISLGITLSTAHLKLQKLSGNLGFIRINFIKPSDQI
jgi:hypothetical protein